MTLDLFAAIDDLDTRIEALGPGALVLRGFARSQAAALLAAVNGVVERAPFRFRKAL